MRIHLPFCTPFEIVGHRPGKPSDETRARAAAISGATYTSSAINAGNTSSHRRFIPLKIRRLPRLQQALVETNASQLSVRSSPASRTPPLTTEIAMRPAAPAPHRINVSPAPSNHDSSPSNIASVSICDALAPSLVAQSRLQLAEELGALRYWLDNGPPCEQEDRRYIAETFKRCLTGPMHTTIDLRNCWQVTSLPRIPACVTNLALYNFRALIVPPDLSQCQQLTDLYLAGCPHLFAPPDLSHCRNLTCLSMSSLQCLSSLDLSHCNNLTEVVLSRCHQLSTLAFSERAALRTLSLSMCSSLTTLPPLGDLRQMRFLDLFETPLTSLPNTILHLPAGCNIELDVSHFSNEVRNRLMNALNAPGYAGPQVHYNMGTPGDGNPPTRSIGAEVAAWCAEAPAHLQQALTGSLPSVDWHGLPLQNNVVGFATFLARLRETSDYRHPRPELKAATQHRVAALLVQLQTDPQLRENCFNLALDAVNSCGDRVALRLLDMENLAVTSQAHAAIDAGDYDANPQALVDLCKGQYRLAIIAEAAEKKAGSLHFTDPIEVHLGYLTKLAEPCNLPVRISTMLYPACAGVDDDDLAAVKKQLSNAGLPAEESSINDQAYQHFLAGSPLMRRLLTRCRPADMSARNAFNAERIELAQKTIRAQQAALQPSDANYLAQNNRLMAEFHAVAAHIPQQETLSLLLDFLSVVKINTTLGNL